MSKDRPAVLDTSSKPTPAPRTSPLEMPPGGVMPRANRRVGLSILGEQGDEDQGGEPDRVRIEPVVGGQLGGDQQDRAERGQLGGRPSPGNEEEGGCKSDREHLAEGVEEVEGWRLPPDAEGRAARGLVAERAVIELPEAAVVKQGNGHEGRDDHEAERKEEERPRTPFAIAGGEQRREQQRAELGQSRQGRRRAASGGGSHDQQAADDQQRH